MKLSIQMTDKIKMLYLRYLAIIHILSKVNYPYSNYCTTGHQVYK